MTEEWSGGDYGNAEVVAECVLAPNAGPMTLDGTNTWILRSGPTSPSVVIDPGPLDDGHLTRVAARAGDVRAVLLTHGHIDHSEGARAFAERVGCGVEPWTRPTSTATKVFGTATSSTSTVLRSASSGPLAIRVTR